MSWFGVACSAGRQLDTVDGATDDWAEGPGAQMATHAEHPPIAVGEDRVYPHEHKQHVDAPSGDEHHAASGRERPPPLQADEPRPEALRHRGALCQHLVGGRVDDQDHAHEAIALPLYCRSGAEAVLHLSYPDAVS